MTRVPQQLDPVFAIVLGIRMFEALVWLSLSWQLMRFGLKLFLKR